MRVLIVGAGVIGPAGVLQYRNAGIIRQA